VWEDGPEEHPGYVPTIEAIVRVLAPFTPPSASSNPTSGSSSCPTARTTWRGPLESITAFRHHPHNPPSLIWPEDRSWFVGIPIYSDDIAIGGSVGLIDALTAVPRLQTRRAARGDLLDIDD
jgi:hypothetical protein